MSEQFPSLTLDQYMNLIQGIPLPTKQQRENFVDYVAHSHSWYKHLSRFLPGAPFYFYIDRYAGCDLFQLKDGTTKIVERAERGFHYNAIPTADYRRHFGYLAYSSPAGSKVMLMKDGALTLARDKIIAVPDENSQMVSLPHEIMETGEVRLTVVIHTHSAAFAYWDRLKPEDREKIVWPEEAGGEAMLESIFERCRQMREPTFVRERLDVDDLTFKPYPSSANKLVMVDPVLYALLTPERLRQYGEMQAAIDRVCELIDSQR